MYSLKSSISCLTLIICLVMITTVPEAQAQRSEVPSLRISQIYGGGGNSDATLHSDFVELFNATPDSINLSGWSVQYAAKEGSNWAVTELGNVTIAGFGYFLIRQAAGDGGSDAGTALETPDVFGDTSMSATDGKVALVAGIAPIMGLTDPAVVDLVGYGSANEAEGAPVGKLSNTTAALRIAGGCVDTNQNAADFERLPPLPRNQMSALNPCSLSPDAPTESPTPTVLATPAEASIDLLSTAILTTTATVAETLLITPTETPTETPLAVDPPPIDPLPPAVTQVFTPTLGGTDVITAPPAIPFDAPTVTATPTPTPSLMPLPPAELTPTDPPLATPPLVTPPPHLLLTEFLADPKAVKDENGEWLELFNADTVAVNLRGWTLADLDSDRHTIALDVIIQPGQYLVLARNGDAALNGGVLASYTYQNLALANSADELLLLAPDGVEVDRVIWGDGTGLAIKAGASAQRTTVESNFTWEASQDLWPGSAGDKGTPGSAYVPPATVPTTTPPPDATPGSTWPLAAAPSDLQIDEVLYDGSDEEFIVLYNTGSAPLDLTGWLIGDAETPGKSEGIYALPAGTVLASGDLLVLARNGLAFRNRWGQLAHAEFSASDSDTPDLVRRRDLAGGQLALNDNGDEVLLFNPAGEVADAVAFAQGNDGVLGLTGELDAPSHYALHRVPGARFPTTNEVRQRFLYAPPDPFAAVTLPAPLANTAPVLEDGSLVVWGSLGVQSIFSAEGVAPPHYVQAAAAAQGLHFLAIADPFYVEPWQATAGLVTLPAWRWTGEDNLTAVIYNAQAQALPDQAVLLSYLDANGTVAQWQEKTPPTHNKIIAIVADTVTAPGALATLYKAWFAAGSPLLPAGNADPPLPGVVAPAPRYTGLTVASLDAPGIQSALAARRGWLTNKPGLWLTLNAVLPDGDRRWMGATLAAGNEMILHLDYGDNSGEPAGIALWQDDKPIQQLATPLTGGRWTVTIPAIPNSFFYAVATQADGDFAVTAPLYVLPAAGADTVLLNEILPAPGADHNGDGTIDSDDEYIELYNSNDHPVALVGWQLSDAAGDASPSRRFTFGPGRFISGRSWLLLRRSESRINLNNSDDYVRLLNPAGEEIDQIAWAQSPRQGRSLSRLPDGGAWQEGSATPGRTNTGVGEQGAPNPNQGHDDNDDEKDDDEAPPVQLPPTYGQAGGPPASIAQSKLAGLEQWAEFRGVVTAPPGLFNATIYVADPAPDYATGPLAGIGINLYLRNGEFPPLVEGDRVLVRGIFRSFRGEMELQLDSVDQIRRLEGGTPLQPLSVTVADIGESLEGRLVTFTGSVSGWQSDSIFLSDPDQPDIESVRVTVRSSLDWRRPYVNKGERWRVTGIVSQFARESPWNGGYRVLVRYKEDLVKLKK